MHSIVLDPFLKKIAFVPDLGLDVIHEFVLNDNRNEIIYKRSQISNLISEQNGPRYIEILHIIEEIAYLYIINELSSSISVYSLNKTNVINTMNEPDKCVLKYLQTIYLPIPNDMYRNNKCGCIIFDPTKKFLLISNRGHDSISVYKRENNFTLLLIIIQLMEKRHVIFNFLHVDLL